MSDNLVNATSSGHLAEGILGVLLLIVSFLFKRSLNHQDNKIEDNRREIQAVIERNRETDKNIAEIHSSLSFLKGYIIKSESENP